jgi:hypothetical protein
MFNDENSVYVEYYIKYYCIYTIFYLRVIEFEKIK